MAAMRIVDVEEAKTQLSRLLREVEAGEEIAIARAGRVIARLVRAPEAAARDWGFFAGQARLDPDAFAPLGDEAPADWDEAPLAP